MDTLAVAGIKPMTFWEQGSLATHQAPRAAERSKISIDYRCPAAGIILDGLCDALDVRRKEMSRPRGGI